MKTYKFNAKETQEFFEAAEADRLKQQKENMGETLKDISRKLQELMENHPDEYWEAAVSMDPLPTLLPRRPSPQKEWRDQHEEKGILLKGQRGSFFDPTTPLNKDVVVAWENVKEFQFQMKDSEHWMAAELRDLPPLGEKTVAQWTPWIKMMFFALNNQQPEKNAHAAKNIHQRMKSRKSDPKSNPTKADVRNALLHDLLAPKKGALTMLAKDLDRVRGVVD